MSIKLRNKRSVGTNSSSMSDLVFLLLIFFILVSTLVSPNAVDLKLPSTSNETSTQIKNVEVYITQALEYYINDKDHQISPENLKEELLLKLNDTKEGAVVLRADETVDIQYVIDVLDAVNTINKETGSEFKVSLAAEAK